MPSRRQAPARGDRLRLKGLEEGEETRGASPCLSEAQIEGRNRPICRLASKHAIEEARDGRRTERLRLLDGELEVHNRCRRSGSRAPTTGSSSRPRSRRDRSPACSETRTSSEPTTTAASSGRSFRFFDPETKTWSIYWADSRRPGKLDPPVLGSFAGDIGRFEAKTPWPESRSSCASTGRA